MHKLLRKNFKVEYAWLVILVLAMQCKAFAAACVPDPQRPYEAVLCKLKKTSAGAGLPNLSDFRRNGESMQYLLLKKAATRAGLSLAKPSRLERRDRARELQANPGISEPVVDLSGEPDLSLSPAGIATLQTCELTIPMIYCEGEEFRLLENQANAYLGEGVLSSDNTLLFERIDDEQEYLYQAYRKYLQKMIGIGLAGSTISYHKFAHMYYDSKENNANFAARFSAMFEFLKKDKKVLQVSSDLPKRAPRLSQCQLLSDDYVICDPPGYNLIYQRLQASLR